MFLCNFPIIQVILFYPFTVHHWYKSILVFRPESNNDVRPDQIYEDGGSGEGCSITEGIRQDDQDSNDNMASSQANKSMLTKLEKFMADIALWKNLVDQTIIALGVQASAHNKGKCPLAPKAEEALPLNWRLSKLPLGRSRRVEVDPKEELMSEAFHYLSYSESHGRHPRALRRSCKRQRSVRDRQDNGHMGYNWLREEDGDFGEPLLLVGPWLVGKEGRLGWESPICRLEMTLEGSGFKAWI